MGAEAQVGPFGGAGRPRWPGCCPQRPWHHGQPGLVLLLPSSQELPDAKQELRSTANCPAELHPPGQDTEVEELPPWPSHTAPLCRPCRPCPGPEAGAPGWGDEEPHLGPRMGVVLLLAPAAWRWGWPETGWVRVRPPTCDAICPSPHLTPCPWSLHWALNSRPCSQVRAGASLPSAPLWPGTH